MEEKAVVEEFRGERSAKFLRASKAATDYQKRFYREAKEKAACGEPIIWTNVGAPQEIFHAMDLTSFHNPNWSAILAAKQMAGHYLDVLNERGYFRDLCRYCSLPLGYFLENKPEDAPWGGAPKPTALVVDAMDDPIVRIWELMAKELNVPLYFYDQTAMAEPAPGPIWHSIEEIEKDSYREDWRLDYAVKETEGLISFLETVTGKSLSEARLREAMERSNEQFDYIQEAMDLVAMPPTRMSLGDHMAHALSTQFFRGHEFGLEQAKRLYKEVKERVDKGIAVCENERLRIMHAWVPNWFTPGFYDYFQKKYGAVISWLGYLPLISRQLIRRDLRDPLRALASRYVIYTQLSHPLLWADVMLTAAKRFHIDAVIWPVAESCKLLCGPTYLTLQAFERAGIPSIMLRTDMVDVRDWDDARMRAQVSNFIETLL